MRSRKLMSVRERLTGSAPQQVVVGDGWRDQRLAGGERPRHARVGRQVARRQGLRAVEHRDRVQQHPITGR